MLLYFLLAESAFAQFVDTSTCKWTPPLFPGITIDLSPLANKPYVSNTVRTSSGDKMQDVQFQVCSTVEATQTSCQAKAQDTDKSKITAFHRVYDASQESNSGGSKILSDCNVQATTATNPTPSLIDANDKQNGITLKYKSTTPVGPPALEINFQCIETTNTDNIEITSTSEDKIVLAFPTVYACPKSCVTGKSVCNGHGICGIGPDGKSTCLCDEGYVGDNCNSEGQADNGEGGFTAIMVSLIITMILLAALLALVIYMFFKLHRLAPIDNEAYSSLSNKFNELGQIT